MPTSSERLRARARCYGLAGDAMVDLANTANDSLEADEAEKLGNKLYDEYYRLTELANKRQEKEQGYEHRRKQG
jgi:hypothetical protein